MIFDTMDNLDNYRGIYNNLDRAIDYIQSNNIFILDKGHYDILGDDIYMNVVERDLKEESESCFELHHRYLDLHIIIDGRERIEFTKGYQEDIIREYDRVSDCELINGTVSATCDLDKAHFVICMLGEPHKPCLKINNYIYVKKAIIKILIND